MRVLRFVVLVGVLFVLSGQASAALILVHDNGGPNHPSGVISDAAVPFEVGDDFDLFNSSRIRKVSWYGAYSGGDLLPNGPDSFTVRFFPFTTATTPNSLPLADLFVGSVSRTITSLTMVNGARVFSYEAELPFVDLVAGHYLLSIVNNTSGMAERWAWSMHSSVTGNDMWQRFSNGANWLGPFGSEMSFQIYAVPEVGTGAMVGVVGLILLLRRGRG